MEVPLQIVFRDMESSDAIAARIRTRVARLERFFSGIISCRVSVEAPHRHQRRGYLYHIRINVRVPGQELVVSRCPNLHGAHKDMYVTIRDAFNEAQRKLEEYVRRRRGDVKVVEELPVAEVVRLVRDGEEGYGFLRTHDGIELYFHAHSVLNDHYDDLKVGSKVRFVKEEGEEGPQASTVELVGRQGHRMFKAA